MRIQDAMTRDVHIANPAHSIREAARIMAEIDAGTLPVGENDRLVGMITDRDIAVRAVAAGKGPDTPVRDVMSQEVCYCFEDQEIDEAAANMADQKIRRLPVVSREKRLVGIVSLGDIALADDPNGAAASTLSGVSEPGGQHSQTGDGASDTLAQRH
jgi:CBS domain-containing protein